MSINALRPYQREVARAVLDSVFGRRGLTFSVEIARQGGEERAVRPVGAFAAYPAHGL